MSTALEDALAAYSYRHEKDRDEMLAWAHKLHSHEIFSKRQIIQITELPHWMVGQEIKKTNKQGGVFNPEMLPMIYDIRMSVDAGSPPVELIHLVMDGGVSSRFLARLLGVPKSTLQYWIRDRESA